MAKTLYFSHDFNASSDDKIIYLCEKFGGIAYGFYWHVIEKLHTEKENKIFIKPYSLGSIAKFLKIDISLLKEIIDYSINECELFESDGDSFWSERVFKNVEKYDEYIEGKKRGGAASAAVRAAAKAEKEEEERLLNNPTQSNTCSTGVEQTSTGVQHNLTEGNKLNKIKLNEIIEDKNKINNPSNQNIKIDTDSDSQKRIETFEKICQKFLEEDIQNFVDYFKTLDIREENIKEALKDYKDDKLIGEVKSIPFKYSYFKEWFKKYITDNRAKYVHVPKFRVTFIDDSVPRVELHAAFKFYWQEEYTIEYIREKIFSGEFQPQYNLNFDKLVNNKLIAVEND